MATYIGTSQRHFPIITFKPANLRAYSHETTRRDARPTQPTPPRTADVSHAVFDRTRPYRHLRNPFTPLKVFSEDQVAAIHEAALVMLETRA